MAKRKKICLKKWRVSYLSGCQAKRALRDFTFSIKVTQLEVYEGKHSSRRADNFRAICLSFQQQNFCYSHVLGKGTILMKHPSYEAIFTKAWVLILFR